jgi:DNA modification methylase
MFKGDFLRISTKTSTFGVSRREGHDSSLFYGSRLYENFKIDEKTPEIENPLPSNVLDKILCQDSRDMGNIPDSSVHLMVTSPPYNVSKDYDQNLTMEEYGELLRSAFAETYRVLVSGGRVCINIANVGRKPYIPYHTFIIDIMLDIGFFMRGEVIWNKNASAGTSCAWGSFASASNPTLRDVHEYILIFSKDKFKREKGNKENTIPKELFLELTKSIWSFPAESARKVGHPAPFPVELPYRCIQLYTFKDDVVIDPFCGVGSACVAAVKSGRHFIGIDTSQEYVKTARERVNAVIEQKKLDVFA